MSRVLPIAAAAILSLLPAQALVGLVVDPEVARRSELEDYSYMFGTCAMLAKVDERLKKPRLPAQDRGWLERSRKRVLEGLEKRASMWTDSVSRSVA